MAWNDPRPMSPHLQIYRLPMTALISIATRITGVALCSGMVLLVCALAAAASGEAAFDPIAKVLSSTIGKLILIIFTAKLYLHLCNGIRHLLWDSGCGFSADAVRKGNVMVLISTFVLTAATWLIALSV